MDKKDPDVLAQILIDAHAKHPQDDVNRRMILCVDDSDFILMLFSQLVVKLELTWRTQCLTDPAEALAFVEEIVKHKHPSCGFAVMIFDYSMPLISGPRLVRKIKRLYEKYEIPPEEMPVFALITGHAEEDLDLEDVQDFSRILAKPSSFDDLTALFHTAKCVE